MNGNFELADSAYPIGYLRSSDIFGSGSAGPLYKLTDMRTLQSVLPHDFSLSEAAALAAKINYAIREGISKDAAGLAQQYLAAGVHR